jgi:hypothetical protein
VNFHESSLVSGPFKYVINGPLTSEDS